MSEHTAVEGTVRSGTGRTAAETDEKWRVTKAKALSVIEAETEARSQKSARLRSLRLRQSRRATVAAASL